jgi:hypothetical protein
MGSDVEIQTADAWNLPVISAAPGKQVDGKHLRRLRFCAIEGQALERCSANEALGEFPSALTRSNLAFLLEETGCGRSRDVSDINTDLFEAKYNQAFSPAFQILSMCVAVGPQRQNPLAP